MVALKKQASGIVAGHRAEPLHNASPSSAAPLGPRTLSIAFRLGNQSPEFVAALTQARTDQVVIDLVRLPLYGSLLKADYRGICW